MNRNIITKRDVRPAVPGAANFSPTNSPDNYLDRLIKYIPADVVAFYLTGEGIIRSASNQEHPQMGLRWIFFVVCVVVTPIYLSRVQKVRRGVQWAISTAAFVVWAFAVGGPLASMAWVKEYPAVSGLLMPTFTFLLPIVSPDILDGDNKT